MDSLNKCIYFRFRPIHFTSTCRELLSVPEMRMGLPLRCRYWSVLQVVAIVVCYRGKVSSDDTTNSTDEESTVDNRNPASESSGKSHEEQTTNQDNSHYLTSTAGRLTNLYNNTEAGNQSDPGPATHKPNSEIAQGCVGSRLNLTCEEMKIIQTRAVVLGDSKCYKSSCCITDKDCTRNANENHRMDVQRRCDNKQSCIVDVLKEEISRGTLGSRSNSDFERITYDCTDDPRISSRPDAAETNTYTPENERTNESLTAVMVIICLIILLATAVVVVVMYRRKKRAQMKLSEPVAMTEVDNRQNESDINANETLETGLHIYSVPLSMTPVDDADAPKTDEDPFVYTEVELRETAWKEGQSDRVTTDETKAAIEAHTTGPDGVKDLVNNGDCFQDHIYSLTSHDMADVYANEPLVETPTRVLEEAVSKTPLPEDDEGLTVIENDLYSH